MPSANILREFLVRIGFDLKPEEISRFKGQMATIGKDMAEVAAGATGMVAAIAFAVSRAVRKYEFFSTKPSASVPTPGKS